MKFKKVFSGYSPKQVDKYITELTQKHEQIRLAQKQYLEELTEENYQLRHKVKQCEQDEQAISKSLIESQKLADELKNDAVHFSEVVLSRAKVFYATWQAYAQTLIATLDNDELAQFNKLMKKIENIINAYEGKNVQTDVQTIVDQVQLQDDDQISQADEQVAAAQTDEQPTEQPVAESPDLCPTDATMGVYTNPISKIEQTSQVIDLRELTVVEDSLEQICIDLGLIPPQNDDN